jgi:VIT1/CCC1 family predicted Fe2+/Mn2+ transporter
MNHSLRIGLSFGLTSGVITTLGLMIGLNAGTHSRLAVIGGVLTIAIADAFSDALGMHISEEAHKKRTHKEIWEATFSTFFSKLIAASTFIIPVLLFSLPVAMAVSVVWGLLLLSSLSFSIARLKEEKPGHVMFEHVAIAIVVVILAQLVGIFISNVFG